MTGSTAQKLYLPDRDLVSAQLERIGRSPAFSRSTSLFAFLRFVVEETLAERGETLKELVIGDALYGRHTPYDPRIESTVRVEARRLRRKLGEHYETAGRNDPVRIELPVGSYRPCFFRRGPRTLPDAGGVPGGADLAVMPFRALSCGESGMRFADGLTDELIHALAHRPELRLAPRLSVFQYKDRRYDLQDAANELGAALLLHGTLRCEGDRYRIAVELADPQGYMIWSDRFDTSAEGFVSQERLAREIAGQVMGRLSAPSGRPRQTTDNLRRQA